MKIKIIVEDNGIGIKRENIKKLFMDTNKINEPTKMIHNGAGIDLKFSNKMIGKMEWSVEYESEEGKGS